MATTWFEVPFCTLARTKIVGFGRETFDEGQHGRRSAFASDCDSTSIANESYLILHGELVERFAELNKTRRWVVSTIEALTHKRIY
jgi:hypothetical protein